MLFNSFEFVFAFLPLAVLVYFLIGRFGREVAICWLVLASLFFYGWWNPVYLLLLLMSMLVNFSVGQHLSRVSQREGRTGLAWLVLGVVLNLGLLGYFKYANFAVDTINALAGSDFHLANIVLPLAISFFTFQQIAYLVDARSGITREYSFMHYALFVTFFPQLIAGPIVHHKDMLPQFMRTDALQPSRTDFAIGLSIFFIGLFKKTVLADGVAPYATPVFDAAAVGESPSFFVAWGGALAYTLQLYFDFSGYSDMAIGAARMFGIRLPLNFHSPYRATNIIEFWRRWHMTLSQFLRDYLYIALGGNRGSKLLRHRNLMLTMLLGGLWHGAGWTFVVWGGLHGLYLVVNHVWRAWRPQALQAREPNLWLRLLGWALTFVAVVIGWVFFRAADFNSAWTILSGMAGANGIALPNALAARMGGFWQSLEAAGFSTFMGGGSDFVWTWIWIALLMPVVLLAPNTQQIMHKAEPALQVYKGRVEDELPMPGWLVRWQWQATAPWAAAIAATGLLAMMAMSRISEFLYFNF